MTKELKSVSGLGFGVFTIEADEYEEFPCSFHRLDEERDAFSCSETPYVFVAWTTDEDGLGFCKRHFAQFAGDMQMALTEFGRNVEGIDTDPHAIVQDGQVVTSSAFTEMFMDAKDKLRGRNT